MAAIFSLFGKLQDDFFTGEVERVAAHHKAAEALAGVIRRRIEEVNAIVLGELRIERETEEAIFLRGEDGNLAGFDDALAGFEDAKSAVDFVEEDSSVGREFELHRLVHAGGERFRFEAKILGGNEGKSAKQSGDCFNEHRRIGLDDLELIQAFA